jgi:uncharacterized membrane protein (UPF0127 family)
MAEAAKKRNPNVYLYAALALVLVYLSAYAYVNYLYQGPSYLFQADGKSFRIDMVAADQQSWEKGLMNATITNATMMVFVFPVSGIYPFWMENTYSNLDMIWLNVSGSTGKVVYLVQNATSCVGKTLGWCENSTYTPTADADYVIEAKAGFARANNITVGTAVRLTRIG